MVTFEGMTKLLVLLGLLGACAGEDVPDQHEVVACAASPNWGTGAQHIERCELGCLVEPSAYPGPACPMTSCPSGDCHTQEGCNGTFTTTDGFVGCCGLGGLMATGIVVRFLECE